MNAWLTPDEITELTEAKRRDVQCRRLAEMGVPFRTSYGGRPLVERTAVLKFRERAEKKAAEPNWDAIKAA